MTISRMIYISIGERISKFASFEIWAPCGPQQSVVRFVTSWNTSDQMIDEFISKL